MTAFLNIYVEQFKIFPNISIPILPYKKQVMAWSIY